jgi:hypothetical protein
MQKITNLSLRGGQNGGNFSAAHLYLPPACGLGEKILTLFGVPLKKLFNVNC